MKTAILLITSLISANSFAQVSLMKKPVQGAEFAPKVTFGNPMQTTIGGNDAYIANEFAYATDNLFLTGSGLLDRSLDPAGEPECKDFQSQRNSMNLNSQFKKIGSPFIELMCKEGQRAKEYKELNQNLCSMLASCFRGKTSLSDGMYEIMNKAKNKTTSEAVALLSESTIQQMMDLEALKAYAAAKYEADFMPKECQIDAMALPAAGTTCMTGIIDKGYEMAARTCVRATPGCNADYVDFIKDRKTENGKTSLMADYIREKARSSIKSPIEEGVEITMEIAEKIYAGKDSPKVKARRIMEFLKANRSNLDPIYLNYFKFSEKAVSSRKEDPIEKGLIQYIELNQHKDPLTIMTELEKLRKEEAHKLLRENCQSTMTLPKLCSVTRDILNGAEVSVPEQSFDRLIKRREEMAVIMDTDPNARMSKQEIADNISRCNTFVIQKGLGKGKQASERLSGGKDLFSDNTITGIFTAKAPSLFGISVTAEEAMFKPTIVITAEGGVVREEKINGQSSQSITTAISGKSEDSIFTTRFATNQIMETSYRKNESRLSLPVYGLAKQDQGDLKEHIIANDDAGKMSGNSLASNNSNNALDMANGLGLQTQQSMMNQRSILAGPRASDTFIDPTTEFQAKTDTTASSKSSQGNVDYNQLLAKIAGLEDKLAQTKKSGSSATTETVVEAKPTEESELVKELKNAKTALANLNKTQAATAAQKAAAAVEAAPARRQAERAYSGEEDYSDATIVASAPQASARSSAPSSVSSAPSSGSRAPASVASRSDSDNDNDDVKSFSRGPVLSEVTASGSGSDIVLTRLDGVSNSKATETISRLIVSESGKPFYIEEGGLVKQIIPEIVDGKLLTDENGKPIYKTVVKGKVGEFKTDKDKKDVKKVAVKATSPADVKKMDESRAPAIRYREFQEVIKLKK